MVRIAPYGNFTVGEQVRGREGERDAANSKVTRERERYTEKIQVT